jgi:hypothetical protein
MYRSINVRLTHELFKYQAISSAILQKIRVRELTLDLL